MQLYFTRHGKTEWNQARRFQGMLGDSPLLPESHEEIKLTDLRNHLDRYDPSAFKGEPIQETLSRIETVVMDAVMQHEGPLLFVGHGASFTAAIQWLAGKPLAELREQGGLVNNSVSLLETNEQKVLPFELKVWNEASFLSNQAGLDALL